MEQLMAASIECHTARTKKHRKGNKTHMVDFIEIDLMYPDHTEIINDVVKLKRRLKNNENCKPSSQRGSNRNIHPGDGSNLQQRPYDVFQTTAY